MDTTIQINIRTVLVELGYENRKDTSEKVKMKTYENPKTHKIILVPEKTELVTLIEATEILSKDGNQISENVLEILRKHSCQNIRSFSTAGSRSQSQESYPFPRRLS